MTDNVPRHTKKVVNKAGLIVRDFLYVETSQDKLLGAIDVISDWRASHAIPLEISYGDLTGRGKVIDPSSISSFRHKRLPSIMKKLWRFPDMKLVTMQDIGGCRAVVANMSKVRELAKVYGEPVRDYISQPKEDGYRSLHFVQQFCPATEEHEWLRGRRIEIQIRSRPQHAWASAVETVDSVMGDTLKAGGGNASWKEFFRLMSSWIALNESCPMVPNTPSDLAAELKSLSKTLRVNTVLSGVTVAVQALNIGIEGEYLVRQVSDKKAAAYLLSLNIKDERLEVAAFSEDELELAKTSYADAEKAALGDSDKQVVLVSAATLEDLKKAYPSYWLDTRAFLSMLKEAIK